MAHSEGVIGEGSVKGLFTKEQRWSGRNRLLMVLTEEPETGAGQGAPSPSHGLGARGEHGYQSPKESSGVGLGRLAETGAEKSTDVSRVWRGGPRADLSLWSLSGILYFPLSLPP